jgi:glycosyltransferase involved in cell wall biosynthesis
MPKISVITSIFNSPLFIEGFLKDALRQSIFFDCEFLLLDCNDHDNDFKLIEPFLTWTPFKYHKIGKCSIYEAWNKGIELSSSDLLSNWNTDDRRKFNSLEIQYEYMKENPICDVCYGPTHISHIPNEIFEEHSPNTIYPALEGTLENQLKHNSPHCLPVWRKNIHAKFGMFDTSYISASDYDMWFRVLKGGGVLSNIEINTGLYYHNPSGISTNQRNLQGLFEEVLSVRKKYS